MELKQFLLKVGDQKIFEKRKNTMEFPESLLIIFKMQLFT